MSTNPEEIRRASILSRLTAGDPTTPLVERVCEVSVELLGVSGAGMCLIGGARHQVILHGTDSLAGDLEDLQLASAHGPCVEAVRTGSPVLVPELENFRSSAWQDYADRALALGARAVFSFPLQAGDVQLGALDLYRTTAGMLDSEKVADALAIVDLTTRSMIAQKERFDIDATISALHYMTVADRAGLPIVASRAADLDITVAQAFGAPPLGDTNTSMGAEAPS